MLPPAKGNDFNDLLFQWFISTTHLNIDGLQETVTDGIIEYLATRFPHVKSLDDVENLSELPIYGAILKKSLLKSKKES